MKYNAIVSFQPELLSLLFEYIGDTSRGLQRDLKASETEGGMWEVGERMGEPEKEGYHECFTLCLVKNIVMCNELWISRYARR